MNPSIFDLDFPIQYLKAALVVSLLSVWVLIGVFYYLNRYTRRGYFTIWTGAWLFYAVWLTLCIARPGIETSAAPLLAMLKHCCIGASAVFLLWGSIFFLKLKAPQRTLALFLCFLFVWSYVGAYHVDQPLWASLPIFVLIGIASEITAACFYRLRRQREFMGAGLLAFGFALWGMYLASYPFLQRSEQLISCGFFISTVLQLFIAVSMIVLVLEEVRLSNQTEIKMRQSETDVLRSRVVSSEERFQALFDQASEAIIIASAVDFKILELNQAAKRLLGVSIAKARAELLGSFCENINAVTPAEWFNAICEKREINIVRHDGGVTPTEVAGAPISFESQPAYQFFFRELTERARLEQQLRQAEKLAALGQMISGIAHELNNPLTVVKGYLELILASHKLPSQTRSDLEKIAHESNRAAKLVANFLSFARENTLHRKSVDLNELIDRVLESSKFELRIAGTELLLDLDGHLPQTYVDPDQIQQVLINLINNAVQAMLDCARPGKLTIRSEHETGTIRIFVQDNGPGIPSEALNHIFEPFFTTKQVGTGTGLGLSIAHSIMSDHAGKISHRAVAGGGACFILEIPVTSAPPSGSVPNKMTTLSASLPSLNKTTLEPSEILVLDDEHSIAEMLGEMIGLLGHTATLCHSPSQALDILQSRSFDLILSDFRMPEMNGQQFHSAVSEIHPELAERIVFLTGDVVNQETQSFLKQIGNPHLAKPFQLTKVEEILDRMLSKATVRA